MNLKGLPGGIYKPLSQKDVETIHNAALRILEKTGFTYESGLDDTLSMLEAAGATVDRTRSRIFFPGDLVTRMAETAPSQVVMYSRDGKNDLDLSEDKVHLGTGGAAIRVLDLETGEARSTVLNDIYQIGRLVDKLENIHFFVRSCIPTDIPKEAYDVNMYYAGFKATTKHFMSGVNDEEGLHRIMELAAMIAGGMDQLKAKPFISVITSFAISPLKLCTQSTRIMQECNRNMIPVALSCAPMAGSTSPITMAATLAQIHAEQLAGITICQLTNPGAPLLYGGIPGMANMNTMGYIGGGVECGMMNAAIHQMAAHIRVPNYNSSGLSDAKVPDCQAGWEKAMTVLLASMGGSNYIHHSAGMLESMMAVAYEQFVIDDEIIGMAMKVLAGIPVDEEQLALDIIDQVGPGGNYMISPHTLKHMRSTYFTGNGVTDRKIRENWKKDGGLDARERGRNIARKILAAEPVSHIPDDIDQAIREKFDILLP